MRTESLARMEKESSVIINNFFESIPPVLPKQPGGSCFYECGVDRGIEIVGFREEEEPEIIEELMRYISS